MRINVSKLTANLPEQREYLQGYSFGLFRAIEASHYQTKSSSVDWDGFTLQDAELALEMAMNYVDQEYADDDDSHSDGPPNEGNAIHEYLHNGEVIHGLKLTQPEKQTDDIEFF
jgi:hypothetical protein